MTDFYGGNVIDTNGVPIPGAKVYVYTFEGALATLTDTLDQSIANPVTTGESGEYGYKAAPGLYRHEYYYGGRVRWIENKVVVGDPETDPLTAAAIEQAVGDAVSSIEAAQEATETARDTTLGYKNDAEAAAGVYTGIGSLITETAVADFPTADGSQTARIIHYGSEEGIYVDTGSAWERQGSAAPYLLSGYLAGQWPFGTRKRDRYSVPSGVWPGVCSTTGTVVASAGSKFTLTGADAVNLSASISNGDRFAAAQTILGMMTVHSGSVASAQVIVQGGGSTINMVEEYPGKWACENTLPASFGNVILRVTKSGTDPLVFSLGYAVAEAGALGIVANPEIAALDAVVSHSLDAAPGNFWPVEKDYVSVTAGAASTRRLNFGVGLPTASRFFCVAQMVDGAGKPTVFDRVYATIVGQTNTDTPYLRPVFGVPGLLCGWIQLRDGYPDGGLSRWLDLYVDNASSLYTPTAGQLRDIAFYLAPPSYDTNAPQSWSADHIYLRHSDWLTSVFQPAFTGTGSNYVQWQDQEYDLNDDGTWSLASDGGGVGRVLEEMHLARRTGDNAFASVHRMFSSAGLAEFAMKDHRWLNGSGVSQHSGHNVHTYHTRRATPSLKVDGVALADQSATLIRRCTSVERIDYSEVYEWGDISHKVANLDTTKTWTAGSFKIKQRLETLDDLELETMYLFMLPLDRYFDTFDPEFKTLLIEQVTLPEYSDAVYTPSNGVDNTYPDVGHYRIETTKGLVIDIEFTSGWDRADRNSYILMTGGEMKVYASPIGVHDSFGLDSNPLSISSGSVFEMETTITLSQAQ